MLDFKTQSDLADAVASILRAQLRATSDMLVASMRGWSLWTQMLEMRPATDNRPMPAHSHWSSSPMSWSMRWPMHWPMHWLMHWLMHWPSQGFWQGGTCGARGFVPLAPIWWTAAGLGLWAPVANGCARNVGAFRPRTRLSQPTLVPPSAARADAGAGLNAGLDPGFASYRSAGGHALAQVIVPSTEKLVEVTAKATLSPLEAMLGVWRAALGV